MEVEIYLNNQLIEPPANIRDLSIELNFDRSEFADQQISLQNFRFVRDNAEVVNDWIAQGRIFEGLPLRVELVHFAKRLVIFNGYLNLKGNDKVFSCNDLLAEAKELNSIDWFNDVADGFTIEYLHKEKKNLSDLFVFIPTVKNDVPQGQAALLAAISFYVITQDIIKQTTDIINRITDTSNPFNFTAIAGLIAQIAYLLLLIAAAVKLINDIILYLISPVVYQSGMYFSDMMREGAAFLGLKFESPILNSPMLKKAVLLPESIEPEEMNNKNFLGLASGLRGFLSPKKDKQKGYYNGTFGDLIRDLKVQFNAKVIIKNGTLFFVPENFSTSNALYELPDLRNDFIGYNSGEIKSNYLFKFRTDLNDKNTIEQYSGTDYQVTQVPKTTINPQLNLIDGFERVEFPYALGKIKTGLTVPEQIVSAMIEAVNLALAPFQVIYDSIRIGVNTLIDAVNAIISVWNAVVGFFGGNRLDKISEDSKLKEIPFGIFNTIENRVGMLMMENIFVQVPKILIINEVKNDNRLTKLAPENAQLTAKYIADNFYQSKLFVPKNGKHNQFKRYNIESVPFCFDDYELVKDDNKMIDNEGKPALIESLSWNLHDQKADIKYRVNEIYTNNLKLVTSEPGR